MRGRWLGVLVLLSACSGPRRGTGGDWTLTVTTPDGGQQDLDLSLTTRDSVLTGTLSGGPFHDQPIAGGGVRGDSLWFQVRVVRPEGTSRVFAFAGRVATGGMSGTVTGRGQDEHATFTAVRASGSARAAGRRGAGGERRHVRAGGAGATPQGADPVPQPAIQATLAAFDHDDVVGMGVLSYANQDFDQFILDLVRDPAFAAKVNDIAVECGNARYQPVLDRYIAGDSVAWRDVEPVWRNTTQPFCGVTTFYEELFPLVRRVNQSLPPARRIRVLAGDPPVDWRAARRDARPPDRDSSIASVMEREVLAKHRKALMIFGVLHLMHHGHGAVGRYEQAGDSGRTFVIMAHNGFGPGNDALEGRLASWPVPSLAALRGTWLDDVDYSFLFGDRMPPRISERVDGYLYLGPARLLLNQPIPARVMMDTAYMAELRRRLAGTPMGPDRIAREAAKYDIFFADQ